MLGTCYLDVLHFSMSDIYRNISKLWSDSLCYWIWG